MNSPFFILLNKEFNQELKNKDAILSMIIFGLSIILIFSFAFNPTSSSINEILPGLTWITFMFSLIIGVSRNFSREKEANAINLILTSPVDRGIIFFSKMFAFLIYLTISQIFLYPLFNLFLGYSIINNWKIWVLSILVNWAISALGIMVAGLGFRSKMGDVLTALLFFPLSTPVLISAVKSTIILSKGLNFENYSFWVMIIFSFAIGATILGMFLFDYAMEE
tara:strand:- start:52 stop:720 length:669 start_codon:yes stop_codon:yes gene_type:complete